MGSKAGHLETDPRGQTAAVQRLQGRAQHLQVPYESEVETTARLGARAQREEDGIESAWNVVRRLEVEVADLRRLDAWPDLEAAHPALSGRLPRTSGRQAPGQVNEELFFETPRELHRAR